MKFSKFFMAGLMAVALLGTAACDKEENKDNPGGGGGEEQPWTPEGEFSQSGSFAFTFEGETVEPGGVVRFHPTEAEVTRDFTMAKFNMVNLTENNQNARVKVEVATGPAALQHLSICFGITCRTGDCPWLSEAISLTPGENTDKTVAIDYKPSNITETAVYKITIGRGQSLEDPQVMFLELKAN